MLFVAAKALGNLAIFGFPSDTVTDLSAPEVWHDIKKLASAKFVPVGSWAAMLGGWEE
jgi:hypothetical protein